MQTKTNEHAGRSKGRNHWKGHRGALSGATTLGRMVVCGCLALQLVLAPVSHAAVEDDTAARDLVTGAACYLLTPVYGAFKLAFAGAGAITGGLAWAFTAGDTDPAEKIWAASMRGTYIIAPEHLRGEKPIRFVGATGRTQTSRTARANGLGAEPSSR